MAKQYQCKKCLEEFEGKMGVCSNCDTDKHTFAVESLVDWLNEVVVAALNNQEARLADLEDEVLALKLRLNEVQAGKHRKFKGDRHSTTGIKLSTKRPDTNESV